MSVFEVDRRNERHSAFGRGGYRADARQAVRVRTTRTCFALCALLLTAACTRASNDPPSANVAHRPPNVFLLNIDMLRADHLGVHGYGRDTTPVLDDLARKGAWFTQARAHAPWTYPSVVSMLTGLYPTSHGATYAQADGDYVTTSLSTEIDTLASRLKAGGYATAAFVTNPLLKRYSGLDHGFDVYRDEFVGEWRRDVRAPWWHDSMLAANVHHEALEWLPHDVESPVFVYIHYIDVHGPFLDPKPFGQPRGLVRPRQAERARLTGEPRQLAIDLYDGELRALDEEIGRLLAALAQRRLLENSIVIITGDHGEEFGEHDGHGHGHSLYDELLHVPLIVVRTEAAPYNRRIDQLVGHIDVVPTILDLTLGETPAGLPGSSLRDALEGRPHDIDRALLAEMDNRGRPVWNLKEGDSPIGYALFSPSGRKYILGVEDPVASEGPADPSAHEELYDLPADAGEHNTLANPDGREASRKRLQAVLAQAREVAASPTRVAIDPETQERLRVLGYLAAEGGTGSE